MAIMPFCSRLPNSILRLLDFLIVCFFMTPLVVCYWQATWLLMDIYVLPGSRFESAVLSTGLGVIFSHFILATQAWFVGKLSKYNKTYLRLAWKTCIYLTSVLSISLWRGLWMLIDTFAGSSLSGYLVSHVVAFVFLTITRTTSSIVFCPGYLLKDQTVGPSTSFNFDAMPLLSCIKNKSVNIFFSHVQTVFFISPVMVCYWRGTWNLGVDLANMAVGTGLMTCLATGCFGYTVSLICFLISHPLEKKLTGHTLAWSYFTKAFIEHVFIYVLGLGSVTVWSALWPLVDQYLVIPGEQNNHWSALVRHCVSFLALYLAQGTINLVGAPACRTHGTNTLEGFFMGTYFIFSRPVGLVNRQEVITKQEKSNSNATHSTGNVIGKGTDHELNQKAEESNATHTEGKVIESESNTTHNELNQIDEENNETHTEGNVEESSTMEMNEPTERDSDTIRGEDDGRVQS